MIKLVIRYWDALLAKTRQSYFKMFMQKETQSHISMFHNVIDDNEEKQPFECRISELKEYVSHCQTVGIRFVHMDELLSSKGHAHMNYAVITFDDGYVSVYEKVFPFMKKWGIPFTVYVTTSFVGQDGYLSREQLKELSKEPLCEVGMHAHEHLMFRYENDDKLKSDFEQCKKDIYKTAGKLPKHYAFPYGSLYAVSRKNCRIVKELGVSSIVLTQGMKLRKKDIKKPWNMPRLNIPGYYDGTVPKKERGLEIGIDD